MMKVLRSLIQEQFPMELRVEIELLSRRRDLVNKEKQEELIKLLRKYNIEDIVPLGPGTNRYAFKLKGFVIKVATDNDGKIDNLKEFKMAKRLYPYVTKIYEVSENGTLLVAEYIQPFESYREMCIYAEKIRTILEELSSVYLIGDVGITPKNYSNWGLRIGTEDPVCLDFAYVYEVRSELFICRHCKMNAMLIPTKDFTELRCSNPACGHRYLFEDIRARIGNDLHRHEIGDLTQEGYPMTESGVLTELTEERSNYLKRKEVKKEEEKPKEPEQFVPDNFVMEHSPQYYIEHKEEVSMNIERAKSVAESLARDIPDNIPILRGRVIKATPEMSTESSTPVIKAKVIQLVHETTEKVPAEPIVPPQEESGDFGDLAFEGTMDQEDPPIVVESRPPVPAKEIQIDIKFPTEPESIFKKSFIDNAAKAVSQISNYAHVTLHQAEVFDEVRDSIKEKIWPDAFYRNIENAIYNSLLTFCGFNVTEVPNANGGTKKVYILSNEITDGCSQTLLFIQRYWMNRTLNEIEELGEMMAKYQEIYGEPGGFQREWLEAFKNRLLQKSGMKIDRYGVDKVVSIVGDMWCVPNVIEAAPDPKSPDPIAAAEPEPEPEPAPAEPEPDPMEGEFDVGDMSAEVVQSPADDDAEPDDEEEEGEDGDATDYISVNVIHDDRFDVVKISCDDPFGYSSIPLYCDREAKTNNNPTPSLADDRNGIWDWLIHMSPDMTFTTRDPDRWLHLANDGDLYEGQIHMCILDEENGVYLMGVYMVDGVYEYKDDEEPALNLDPEFLADLNRLICQNIGLSKVSHYPRSVSMWDEAKDESYIEMVMTIDNGDEEEETEVEMSPAEKAALQVLMGTNDPSTSPEHVSLKEAAARMADGIMMKSEEDDHEEVAENPPQEQQEVSDVAEPVPEAVAAPTPHEEELKSQKVEEPEPVAPPVQQQVNGQGGIFKPIHRM